MELITATQARNGLFPLLHETVNKGLVFHIAHKEGNSVLLSEEEYESLIETLELLSAPNFRKKFQKARQEIKNRQTVSMEKVFS